MNSRSATPGSSILICSWSRASCGVASTTIRCRAFSLPQSRSREPSQTAAAAPASAGPRRHFHVAGLRHRDRSDRTPCVSAHAPAPIATPTTPPPAPTAATSFRASPITRPTRPRNTPPPSSPIPRPAPSSSMAHSSPRTTGASIRVSCSALASATRARTSSTTMPTGRRAWPLPGLPAIPVRIPPKTVIRAGYGWFFNRFIVPFLLQRCGHALHHPGHPRQSHQSEKLYRRQSQFLQSQRRRTCLRFDLDRLLHSHLPLRRSALSRRARHAGRHRRRSSIRQARFVERHVSLHAG